MADSSLQHFPVQADRSSDLSVHEKKIMCDEIDKTSSFVLDSISVDIKSVTSANDTSHPIYNTNNSNSNGNTSSINSNQNTAGWNHSEEVEHVSFTCVDKQNKHVDGVINPQLNVNMNENNIVGVNLTGEQTLKLVIPQIISSNCLNIPSKNSVTDSSSSSSQQIQSFDSSSSPTVISPDSGKRRRIQHDYRRLSSSGYVDDYETGKDSRFTSPTEADCTPLYSGRNSKSNSPKSVSPQTRSPVPNIGLKMSPSHNSSGTISSQIVTDDEKANELRTKICEWISSLASIVI